MKKNIAVALLVWVRVFFLFSAAPLLAQKKEIAEGRKILEKKISRDSDKFSFGLQFLLKNVHMKGDFSQKFSFL